MNVLKGLALSTAAILAISGCGGSSDSAPVVVDTDVSLDGAAVDGYLNGATICLDINGDGLCTIATEPTTNTDANGDYTLTLTAAQAASSASLLVYGGIDVDTNEWFGGRLKAVVEASGTVNITPLTTMVESVVQTGTSTADAEQQVADALGLTDVAFVNSDPVALYISNPEVLAAALTVQKIVEVMATAAVTADSSVNEADAIENIYADLAAAIATVAADTTTSGVTAIVTVASTTSTNIDADVVAVAQIIQDAVVAIVEDVNNDLGDATLLIDATAEVVEAEVVTAVNAGTVLDDTTTIDLTVVPTVEFIAIANIFDAYGIVILDAAVTEIEAALGTTAVSVSSITGLTLTATNGADTAVTGLIAAITAQELVAEIQAVEIYLSTLGITGASDAVLTSINGLSGYSDTLTEAEFVALLRTTTNAALITIADQLDPPAAAVATTWADITTFYEHWEDQDSSGNSTLVRGTITLINGTLTWIDESTTDGITWTERVMDDYRLNTSTGAWELDTNVITYTTSADGQTITLSDGEQVQLASSAITDLSGTTAVLNSYTDLNVTFSAGAEGYNLLFKDIERYELNWMPTTWDSVTQTPTDLGYTSIPEFAAAGQCVYWKETLDGTNGCAQFSPTTTITDTSGNLVMLDYNTPDPTTGLPAETVVGTWTRGQLPGQTTAETVLTTITDTSFLEGNSDYNFITVLNGFVWMGSHKPAAAAFAASPWDDETPVNAIGSADIVEAILSQSATPVAP